MSDEDVAIVLARFEQLERSGEPDLATIHPDIVYHPRPDEPDLGPVVGRDAYERILRGFREAFSDITIDVLEVIAAGDHVIVSTVFRGRGSASGAEVTDDYVYAYKLRDGMIVEGWEYRTMDEARKATGLPRRN